MPAVAVTDSTLDLVGLTPLMARTVGSPSVGVGLVDGPVGTGHPDLAEATVLSVGDTAATCRRADSDACAHGTFVAGVLVARRGSAAPAICPGCTLLVRPVFTEVATAGGGPLAAPADVGDAIADCVTAGARVINLSAAVGYPSVRIERSLRQALDHAVRRGTLVVAAAGNQATLGSSEITRHPGVVSVVACDHHRRPLADSNLGGTLGLRGLGAPGRTTSLGPDGRSAVQAGTSVATAFVTGAAALLVSLFPDAPSSAVQHALLDVAPRRSVVPPLLDATAAYQRLARSFPPIGDGSPAPPARPTLRDEDPR